jgi:uncharacterized protein
MYKWLRNTHLLIGLFSFLFLLMYGVSSVQMAHNTWFDLKPAVIESQTELATGLDNPRDIARQLMDRGQVKGELQQIRKSGPGYNFRVVRPGTVQEVDYTAHTGAAKIRTSVAGLMGMLNRIHHVGGVWHEYTLTNVWAVFVGIISTMLVILSLTGIYLWFKIHSERVIGVILLALSLGYSLTLLVLIRTA